MLDKNFIPEKILHSINMTFALEVKYMMIQIVAFLISLKTEKGIYLIFNIERTVAFNLHANSYGVL